MQLFEYAGKARSVFFFQHNPDSFRHVLPQVLAEHYKQQQAVLPPTPTESPVHNDSR